MSDVFIEKILVRDSDVDMYNRWKYSAIFTAIQEGSGHHMETIHSGSNDLLVNNLAWVIARIKVEMTRFPQMGERIMLKTWAGNPIKFIYPRYTLLEDENGMEVGKAVVLWSIIDLSTHNVVIAPESLIKYFVQDNNPLVLLTFPKSLDFDQLYENDAFHQVKYSDIDFNMHANNAKYLDWIYNVLDYKYLRTHLAKSVQINYQKEIKLGEKVVLNWSLENDVMKVNGLVNGVHCFNALLEF